MELIGIWVLLIVAIVVVVLAVYSLLGDDDDDNAPLTGQATQTMMRTTQQCLIMTTIL